MNRFKPWGILAIVAALASVGAASGQGTDLKTILSNPNVPMSMKLKDLNHDWRRFKLVGQMDLPNILATFGEITTPGIGILYTRGDSLTVNTETYLIAYQVPTKAIDLNAMMSGGYGRKPAPAEKLTPETPLVLSLINLRTAGSLTQIQPFDLDREIAANHEQEEAVAKLEATRLEESATSEMGQLNSAEARYRVTHHRFGTVAEVSVAPNTYLSSARATSPATAQMGYYYTVRVDPGHPTTGYFAVAIPVKKEYSRVFYTDEVGVIYAALKPTESVTTDHHGKAPGPNWTVAGY